MTKDEQYAWKLQMEEQYYQELLFQRESGSTGAPQNFELQYDYDSDDLLQEEETEESEGRAQPLLIDLSESDSESQGDYEYTESEEETQEPQIFETYEELLNLTEIVPPVSRGVSEQDLANLPSFEITKQQVSLHENCNVCLEDFESGQECRALSCTHVYHKSCIDQWLSINKICPVCRAEIE